MLRRRGQGTPSGEPNSEGIVAMSGVSDRRSQRHTSGEDTSPVRWSRCRLGSGAARLNDEGRRPYRQVGLSRAPGRDQPPATRFRKPLLSAAVSVALRHCVGDRRWADGDFQEVDHGDLRRNKRGEHSLGQCSVVRRCKVSARPRAKRPGFRPPPNRHTRSPDSLVGAAGVEPRYKESRKPFPAEGPGAAQLNMP